MKIFGGTANTALTNELCEYLRTELGQSSVTRFSDGEIYFQILENVQNGFDSRELKKVSFETVSTEVLMAARAEVARVKVEPALFNYIVRLVARTRNWPSVSLGGSLAPIALPVSDSFPPKNSDTRISLSCQLRVIRKSGVP